MKRIFIALILGAFSATAFAAGDREPPMSWQTDADSLSGDLPAEIFPSIDAVQLRERDADPAKLGEPLQFAEPFASRATLADSGRWTTLSNGDRIWRLAVEVPGATDLSFGFTDFHLSDGARLHIYDAARTFFQGGWDSDENDTHGEFWTPVIPGDSAVVEVFVPAGAAAPEFTLAQVSAGYRDFFGRQGGPYMVRQGSCNNDVVCPEGDPWRDEIRSVGVYTLNGIWTCTGTLINDVSTSLTPWFLTANHCNISTSNDQSMVVYWNFESPNCGDLSGGSLADSQSGATFRAARSDVDMALVELDEEPPEAYNVHYAGWDRTNTQPGGAVAIHHPNTDEKAISFAESDLDTTPSCIGGPGTPNTHWEVPFWDDGTTEPGSSGSGIWHPQNKRLVGFLSGGLAACGNQEYDCYGKFAVAWDGSSASSRLRDWLDPAGTNPDGIDGTDPASWDFDLASDSLAQCGFDALDIPVSLSVSGGFSDPVNLSTSGTPAGTTTNFSVNPVTPPGSTTLTLDNLSSAGTGTFQFELAGSGGGIDVSRNLSVTLTDAAPAAATITGPADGAINVPATPTISWTSVAQAAEYQLEIATDAAFNDVVYSAVEATTQHTVSAALDTNTTHYVRVRAGNQCGDAAWSSSTSFTTQAGPGDCPLGTETQNLLSEDFEDAGIPAGWSTAGSSGGTTWTASDARAWEGSRSAFAESISGTSDQRLVSPQIALPASAVGAYLNFRTWQDIESASGGGCFDGGVLEISTDDGNSWTQVPDADIQVRAYDGVIDAGSGNPLEGASAWCGDPRDTWERYSVDLSDRAGETVRLRFRFGTNVIIRQTGWHVDDLQVDACGLSPQIFLDSFEAPPAP
ncbi:MAG: choice-of-anchor J domain-containing protein [Wenzhouxiangella sp.]|jgi:hypothetical protein|nr:choice-of-anchor J domain-containing protein [Wenzhouxiangella sp.]